MPCTPGVYARLWRNLFGAVELLAKAQLLSLPDPKQLGKVPGNDPTLVGRVQHGDLHEAYKHWGELGNTDQRFVTLLYRLKELRNPA